MSTATDKRKPAGPSAKPGTHADARRAAAERRADAPMLSIPSPAGLAIALGAVVGVGMVVLGANMLGAGDLPLPLSIAVVACGGLELGLGYLALRRRRAGWSFFLSLNGTLAVATFFGAPKIRDVAEISLGLAIAPCAVFATMLLLAAFDHDQY
jgi:hypothetical protein